MILDKNSLQQAKTQLRAKCVTGDQAFLQLAGSLAASKESVCLWIVQGFAKKRLIRALASSRGMIALLPPLSVFDSGAVDNWYLVLFTDQTSGTTLAL